MKYLKSIRESVLGNLLDNRDPPDDYRYLGERNSAEWRIKLQHILDNYKRQEFLQCDINDLNELFNKELNRSHGRTLDEDNPVVYSPLTKVQNSRFDHCWFLGSIDDDSDSSWHVTKLDWDICIQYFEDEYFLVNIGSGNAWYNYWYWCDQFHGLEKLIKDKLLR
jgi:hypothetical protein